MKEKVICSHCGSEDVMADAYASWNKVDQVWEVESIFEKGGYCSSCDMMINIQTVTEE